MNELKLSEEALGRANNILNGVDCTSSDSRLRGLVNARNELDIAYRCHERFLEEVKKQFELDPKNADVSRVLQLALLQQGGLVQTIIDVDSAISKERFIRAMKSTK